MCEGGKEDNFMFYTHVNVYWLTRIHMHSKPDMWAGRDTLST